MDQKHHFSITTKLHTPLSLLYRKSWLWYRDWPQEGSCSKTKASNLDGIWFQEFKAATKMSKPHIILSCKLSLLFWRRTMWGATCYLPSSDIGKSHIHIKTQFHRNKLPFLRIHAHKTIPNILSWNTPFLILTWTKIITLIQTTSSTIKTQSQNKVTLMTEGAA